MGCGPYVNGAYNAAHGAAAISYLQDTDIPLAFRYRTDGTGMFGLFGDGTLEPAWSPSGLSFGLMAILYETPRRLAVSGGDDAGFTVLAGSSPDGGSAHVLIAALRCDSLVITGTSMSDGHGTAIRKKSSGKAK